MSGHMTLSYLQLPVAATVERRPGAYNAKRNLAERLKAGSMRRGTPSALVLLPSSPTVVFLSRRDPGGGAAEISGATASVSSAASPPTATEAKLFGKSSRDLGRLGLHAIGRSVRPKRAEILLGLQPMPAMSWSK